ncbi:hypothetical protein N8835_02880 [Alphaproteobacteria bacterium]|nr:hypothetical protein [Alphaproteobacteria bacterium]
MRQLIKFVIIGCFAAGSNMAGAGIAMAGGLPGAEDDVAADTTSAALSATENAPANDSAQTTGASTTHGSSVASGDTSNASNSDADIDTNSFVAIEDDPLIIDASSVMDGDGVGSIQVQWQVSNEGIEWSNMTGETRQSFTPREKHVGKRLRVELSYVDGQGNLETILSPSSSPVQNVNDKPTGAPQLVGAAREEDALIVDTSMIADDDGLGKLSVIWQRSSTKTDWTAYPEGSGGLLQLTQGHVGYSYRAVISYVDGHGTKEILVTNPSEVVINVDDPVQGEVLVSGEAAEGQTLVASTAGISDEDGIASISVGWESSTDGRNWRAIETVGSSQIALTQGLVNRQLRARVSVVDTFGVETIIFSQATNTVQNVNNKPAGTIFVRRVGN